MIEIRKGQAQLGRDHGHVAGESPDQARKELRSGKSGEVLPDTVA